MNDQEEQTEDPKPPSSYSTGSRHREDATARQAGLATFWAELTCPSKLIERRGKRRKVMRVLHLKLWRAQGVAITCSVVVLLTGCGPRGTSVESGVRTKILHVGIGSEPQSLDPHTTTGLEEYLIDRALFEGLVIVFPNRDNNSTWMEAIQEQWRAELGIKITLSQMEWKVWLDAIKEGDFQLSWDGWSMVHPSLKGFVENPLNKRPWKTVYFEQ